MKNHFLKTAGFSKKNSSHECGRELFIFIIILLTAGVIFLSGYELLQESSPQIGQVDLEIVLAESQVGQEHQAELEETGLELERQYERAGDGSSLETYEQEKIFQRYLRQKERLEAEFQAKLDKVLTKLAEEKDLKAVLTVEAVYSGALDITAETGERLDELAGISGEEKGEEYFSAGD